MKRKPVSKEWIDEVADQHIFMWETDYVHVFDKISEATGLSRSDAMLFYVCAKLSWVMGHLKQSYDLAVGQLNQIDDLDERWR
jgi:hypothetical protein